VILEAAAEFVHLGPAADEEGGALVDAFRDDVEDATDAVGGDAAGLLGDEGDRVGLVEKAELAVGYSDVGG